MPIPPDNRAAGDSGHITDHNNISDTLTTLTGTGPVNVVTAYGADPSGAADSGAAIGNAVTAAAAAGRTLYFPAGTYKVTSALNWKTPGLVVAGAGSAAVTIQQATANTPIVQVAGQGQRISGLTLAYTSQQSSSSTSAIAMEFGDDTAGSCFESVFEDLYIKQAATGMAVNPAVTTTAGLFSCAFRNVHILGYSINAVKFVGGNGTGANCTGCVFTNVYVHNNFTGTDTDSTGYPVHFQGWDEVVFDQLNIEHAVISSSGACVFSHCGNVVVNGMHLEHLEMAGTPGDGLIGVGTGTGMVQVNGLTVRFCTFTGASLNSVAKVTGGSGQSFVLNGLNFPASDGGDSAPALALIDFNSAAGVSAAVTGINGTASQLYTENYANAGTGCTGQITSGNQVTYFPAGSQQAARDNLGAFKIVHAVADFGVDMGGVNDTTTALQNFFTAIGAGGSKSGYKGYIPPGTAKITSAVIGKNLTQCVGGGKYVTTIKQVTNNQDVLQFLGSSGVRVDSTGTSTTNGSTTVGDTHAIASDLNLGISGTGIPAGATITSVTPGTGYVISRAATAAGTPALTVATGNMLGVELSDFSLAGPYRVDKTGTSTTSGSTTVGDTNAVATDAGLSISGTGIPGGTTISSVTPGTGYVISAAATATGTPNLTIGGTSTGVGLNLNYWLDTCSLKRMIVQGNGSHGILLQNSYLISFEHIWHYNNGGDGLHAVTSINAVKWDNCEFFGNAGDGAYINGVAGAVMTGCDVESNGKHGVETTNCYTLTIEGCDFENNGTSSPGSTYAGVYVGSTNGYAGPRIVGCNFTGTSNVTANGVELSASVTSAYIEGCPFNNFANADILIDSGATGVILAPNNVHQAGSEPLIIDNSTNGAAYLGEEKTPFSAVDAGYKAWNYDFALEPNMNSTTGMVNYTAGVIFGARIQVRHVMTVSKISIYWAQPTGGSPANCFLALYDSAGNLKGTAANITSTASGLIQASIGSVTLQPGYYYVAVLIGTQGSTTGGAAYPTLTLVSSQATGYQGAGLSASQYRWAKLGNLTAQTSMPSSITLANNVSSSLPFGCALL